MYISAMKYTAFAGLVFSTSCSGAENEVAVNDSLASAEIQETEAVLDKTHHSIAL